MGITGKRVLILGAYGLVGYEVARKFLCERPQSLVLLSLRKAEVDTTIAKLREEFPDSPTELLGEHGNLFVSEELKDVPLSQIKSDPNLRRQFVAGVFDDLVGGRLHGSFLYRVVTTHRPEIVVDAINTATVISYQNVFEAAADMRDALARLREGLRQEEDRTMSSGAQLEHCLRLADAAEQVLSSMYVPQLVSHVQILYRALRDAGVATYIKVGTSGTGGMGLNIPYTHGEERPSSLVLSKAAVAGAHTLLLYLMGRTPDAPVIKEVKPTTAIGWRQIRYGEIQREGRALQLYSGVCEEVGDEMCLRYSEDDEAWASFSPHETEVLRSVFIDVGESGYYSLGEFSAISSMEQMEFVTSEEVAQQILFEAVGRNTGHDVVNALDSAGIGPSYRAGFLRSYAIREMKRLEREHGCRSVAFEMLGPPRVSKLLFECHLLKLAYGKLSAVVDKEPAEISTALEKLLLGDEELISQITSIGIPILLKDGKRILRGPTIKVPAAKDRKFVTTSPRDIDQWTREGWVDLRESNSRVWSKRLRGVLLEVERLSSDATSSSSERGRMAEAEAGLIDIGEIVGWIFNSEERGSRLKS